MALSRTRTTLVINAVIPFTRFTGSGVLTLVTISGQFPFFRFTGTADNISLT